MIAISDLIQPLIDTNWEGGIIRLEPFTAAHKDGMRACCDPADPIWEVYPVTLAGDAFDPNLDAIIHNPDRHVFAILADGKVVGMTSYLNCALDRQTLEIGGTFMAPAVRGSGINARVKKLLLDRAYGTGIRRVEFRIDERNGRSQAAVAKLGATKEGSLRAERITWTGHVRNTAIWSLLAHEWR